MKIDSRFGSMWDEFPLKTSGNTERIERKVPETVEEMSELAMAARESMTTATMKTWDSHNDMLAKSSRLRKIQARKKAFEDSNTKHREEQRELMAKIAIENANRESNIEAKSLARKLKLVEP